VLQTDYIAEEPDQDALGHGVQEGLSLSFFYLFTCY
jgi:hypothetical protein